MQCLQGSGLEKNWGCFHSEWKQLLLPCPFSSENHRCMQRLFVSTSPRCEHLSKEEKNEHCREGLKARSEGKNGPSAWHGAIHPACFPDTSGGNAGTSCQPSSLSTAVPTVWERLALAQAAQRSCGCPIFGGA